MTSLSSGWYLPQEDQAHRQVPAATSSTREGRGNVFVRVALPVRLELIDHIEVRGAEVECEAG